MVPILAYRIQEREYGGLANTTRKKLREIAKSVDPGKQSQGTQLIQDLKNDGLYQIKPYQAPPQTDKIMRLHAQTGHFESGRVLLPASAPWLPKYKRELTTIPDTKFDDQVDSTTQALDYFGSTGRSLEMWERLGR